MYCKFRCFCKYNIGNRDLIGTFCIVNVKLAVDLENAQADLIGTFCIVNILGFQYIFSKILDLIGTFCIVNTQIQQQN